MNKHLIFLSFILMYLAPVLAWEDCPYGLENDPYPGNCGRYVDTDNSGYCDHSETLAQAVPTKSTDYVVPVKPEVAEDPNELITGQELKTKTVAEVAEIYKISVEEFILALKKEFNIPNLSRTADFQYLHDNYGVQPSVVKSIASDLATGSVSNETKSTGEKTTNLKPRAEKNYNFGIIAGVTLSLYAISWFLAYKKVWDIVDHRKLWNVIMGVNFFSTAVLGLLLVLRISYGFTFPLPFNILFWHVETGIVFALIAIFHALWHWPYFKMVFTKKLSKQRK